MDNISPYLYLGGVLPILAWIFVSSHVGQLFKFTHRPHAEKAFKLKQPPSQLARDKELYHLLQAQETTANDLRCAQERLLELLDLAVFEAQQSSSKNILSIREYSATGLLEYLAAEEAETNTAWSAYLARRQSGGPRELLRSREHAEHWLRLCAPVKFVDGAWLAGLHQAETPRRLRSVTRIGWQILSEEYGDGELSRNHVHVFSKLLDDAGVRLKPGDSREFIDRTHNPNGDARLWMAGIAQLALGLFPMDFLPEIIGFNTAYELVCADTLVSTLELRELGIDATYFMLHITIDNSDSGHSAMAAQAIVKLMDLVQPEDQQSTWRRVQAGFLLAKGLPTIPSTNRSQEEQDILRICSNKSLAAKASHQVCPAVIGGSKGKRLQDWLDPDFWESRKHAFLSVLADSRWVVPGRPQASRLVKEMCWGGRMFGAFTTTEKLAFEHWIAQAETGHAGSKGKYSSFTGHVPEAVKPKCPVLHSSIDMSNSNKLSRESTPPCIPLNSIPMLLFGAAIPFQYALRSPARSATSRGAVILRILRALNGFGEPVDGVLGMDEVKYPRAGVLDIALKLANGLESGNEDALVGFAQKWQWLDQLAMMPHTNYSYLMGAQKAFNIEMLSNVEGLSKGGLTKVLTAALEAISEQIRVEIERSELDGNDFKKGFRETSGRILALIQEYSV